MNLKWSCGGERCGQKCNEKVGLKWAALTGKERNIKWWNGMTNYVWEVSLPCAGKPKTPLQNKKKMQLNLWKRKRNEPISLCFTLLCFCSLVMLQWCLSVCPLSSPHFSSHPTKDGKIGKAPMRWVIHVVINNASRGFWQLEEHRLAI